MAGDVPAHTQQSTDEEFGRTLSSRRLEAYSDGVFAIAATLLVLDLSVSGLGLGSNPTSADVWRALADNGLTFLNFALSFVLLGILWTVHVRQFEFVEHVDGFALTLNTLRLLGVVLVPFTTTMTDELNSTVPGRVLLPLNFLYVVAVSFVQWTYLSSKSRSFTPRMSDRYRVLSRRNSLVALITAAAVSVAAIWLGSFAFLLFFVANVFDNVDRRAAKQETARHPRRGRRHPEP